MARRYQYADCSSSSADDERINQSVENVIISSEDESEIDLEDFRAELGDQDFWARAGLNKGLTRTSASLKLAGPQTQANASSSCTNKKTNQNVMDIKEKGSLEYEADKSEEVDTSEQIPSKRMRLNEKFDNMAKTSKSSMVKQLWSDQQWFRERVPVTKALLKYLQNLAHNLETCPEEFYCSMDLPPKPKMKAITYGNTEENNEEKQASQQSEVTSECGLGTSTTAEAINDQENNSQIEDEDNNIDPRVCAALNSFDKEFKLIKQEQLQKLETHKQEAQKLDPGLNMDTLFDLIDEIDFDGIEFLRGNSNNTFDLE